MSIYCIILSTLCLKIFIIFYWEKVILPGFHLPSSVSSSTHFLGIDILLPSLKGGPLTLAKWIMILHQPGQSYWFLRSQMIHDKPVEVLFKHVSSGDSREESIPFTEKVEKLWTLTSAIPIFHGEAWEGDSNAKKNCEKKMCVMNHKFVVICYEAREKYRFWTHTTCQLLCKKC